MNIKQIDLIGIPVSDQQASLDFYTKILGFEERVNMVHFEDQSTRWIELIPPGASTAIVLASWKQPSTHGVLQLVTTNVEADYAELKAKGLELPALEYHPWGISVMITDPDGNEWLLQQNLDMSDKA